MIHAANFNFWGVTFARDDNRFYATLGTGGKTYLVQGDLARRPVRSCRRRRVPLALARRQAHRLQAARGGGVGPVQWRVAVLDLATLRAHPLAETRNVDDQVEWLDNDPVVYGLPESQSSPVTESGGSRPPAAGEPQRVTTGAWSPAVVRG